MTGPDPTTGKKIGPPDRWSGRWSGHVELPPLAANGSPASQPITGHESTPRPASAPPRPEGQARRRGRLQLLAIQRAMSERDLAILSDLAALRFLTTSQLEALHFAQHSSLETAARVCRRVLKRLHDWRVIEHLERRVGGVRAGSQSYVWRVGATGDRLLRSLDHAPRDRRHEPSLHFLDHTLAAAACIVELTHTVRTTDLELVRWEAEPTTWRRYLGAGGSRQTLKPDLYVVTASGAYEDHWFVEVDRGTEAIPTVLTQCRQYEAYRRTGQLQQDIEVFPYIVWVVPDNARGVKIAAAIERSRDLDPAHYRVVRQGQLAELARQEGDT